MLSDKGAIEKHVMDWNRNMEDSAKSIGERANGYKIMHVQTASFLTKLYDILMYVGIACGPLSVVISSVGVALHPTEDNMFPIIAAIISTISAILIAAVKFGQFEEQT